MGLLGDSFDDPKSLATWQLIGGLLSPGSFGQGLSRGMAGYQGTLANAQDMQAKQQAMQMQNIQMQQQKRMFDLQTPFLEEAVRRMQGGSPADQSAATVPSTPAPMSQSMMFSPEVNAQRATQQQTPMHGAPAQSAPAQGGSMFPGVPDSVAFNMIGTGGFNKLPDIISKYNEPTEFVKTLVAAGIDPRSQQGQALIQANISKSNYIAPVNARPGAILRDPVTMQPKAFNPHVPEGGTPVFDASGNVVAINPLQGATSVMQAAEAARAAGKAQYTPYAGYDASGRPAPATSVANVLAPSQPGVVTPAAQLKAIKESLPIMVKERDAMPPGPDKDALTREINRSQNALLSGKPWSVESASSAAPKEGGIYATPPLGAVTAADFQQSDLGKRFSTLRDQASQAQTTNSYLQNIKQLAATASTGQFSDKQKFINSLLSTSGISEKATDAVTANNLLDKYGNQIVARLGQGGLGTDSARAILQSAYPNAHMTPQAINEAADNLIGANEMTKAKMTLLSPHGNAKDPVAYQEKEQAFDQAADPRLWQIKAMTPQQAQTYLISMPPAVRADLQQRAKTLKGLGAL